MPPRLAPSRCPTPRASPPRPLPPDPTPAHPLHPGATDPARDPPPPRRKSLSAAIPGEICSPHPPQSLIRRSAPPTRRRNPHDHDGSSSSTGAAARLDARPPRHRATGRAYALKTLYGNHDDAVRRQIAREIAILRTAEHPAVVRCHGMYERGGELQILLEYMDGGSLDGRRIAAEPFLADVARQVLSGIAYLHRAPGALPSSPPPPTLTDADLRKPQVGVSSVWYEGNTCNMHLLRLAEAVRDGVREADMVGFRFNTVGVSDAISMGTRGMCYSLQSRDLIADSIETVMGAQHYDANISIPGCDKNMPGTIMAMGRLNRPSIMIYGGTIKPGHFQGNSYDIVSAFQCYGEFVSGSISDEQRKNVLRNSCPGAGACGGMYTANTMASAIETMGMSLPYSSSTPAEDPLKLEECRLAGKYLLELLKMDLKPRDIITDKSLRNAMVIVMALGGSTNAVLHLIAIARSVGLQLTLDDFQKVSDQVPFLADLKPSGKYVMEDLHKIGGTPAVIHYLLEQGFLDGDCMTVTGKTLAENAKIFPPLSEGQQIIRPLDNPIKSTGHIQILYGNLAPEGSVAKITGKEGLFFSGPALVFDGEESMITAISENPASFKGRVVVIRGEGPKGGPGMPEMLTPTSAIMGAGLGKECALLTDGRFSGGSHGFVVGHICPESQEGGPIGLIQNDDIITIDVARRVIDVDLTEEQMEERRRKWRQPPYKVTGGALWKYMKLVSPASSGCVTDELGLTSC